MPGRGSPGRSTSPAEAGAAVSHLDVARRVRPADAHHGLEPEVERHAVHDEARHGGRDGQRPLDPGMAGAVLTLQTKAKGARQVEVRRRSPSPWGATARYSVPIEFAKAVKESIRFSYTGIGDGPVAERDFPGEALRRHLECAGGRDPTGRCGRPFPGPPGRPFTVPGHKRALGDPLPGARPAAVRRRRRHPALPRLPRGRRAARRRASGAPIRPGSR